jgi:uncharacterized cupredoxin-like copper-binding protein
MLLVISACGDDGPDGSTANTTAETAAETTMAMDEDEMADMDEAEMADMDEAEMEEGDEHGDFDFGEAADPADADRVIEIVTDDDFTITPSEMTIAVGETITFKVTNEGKLTHDFTLGRADLQDEHDIEMAEMNGMAMADEPNAFMLESGETKELTWHFTEGGEVLIGCHIPGHYAAGMKAEINVEA